MQSVHENPELMFRGLVVCREKHPIHPFGIFYGQNPLDFSFPLFLLDLILVLSVTKIVRYVLKPLRQPRIVAEIIGGIIVGPSVLGRSKKFQQYLFPENAVFVLQNLGILGFMYFLFLSGVKTDLTKVVRAKKKQLYMATIGIIAPLITTLIVAFSMKKYFQSEEITKFASIYGISATIAITSFPVLYPVLRELNLLSSDIGRLALSLSIITDVIGIHGTVIFEAAKQGEEKSIAAVCYVISFFVVVVSIVGGIRYVMRWIIQSNPEGKPVGQIYVIAILLGVCVAAFITDMTGLAIANGSLWLGLAIPDGPPLGSTIVEKCETVVNDILMPISYAYVGILTDISSMSGQWSALKTLFWMALVGSITKLLSVVLAGRFFNMTYRDSLALALIMSIRGQIELLLFIHWMDFRMIGIPQFTMLVLMVLSITAIATPMISLVYDPTRPYMVDKRRNIQHNAPGAELEIVACIYNEKSVSGITKLLEVSNPTETSPFSVHALQLTELVGSAAPFFVDHENEDESQLNPSQRAIHNAMKLFQEGKEDAVKMHCYTSVSPIRSMYQDICEVALSKKASLIILPYHKEQKDNAPVEEVVRGSIQSVNFNVLKHAPCSVALLVEKSSFINIFQTAMRRSSYQFAVLFLGGPDSREALTYADRMALNPDVSLTVVRFLSDNNQGDDMMEKKLDDGIVTWFWVKNEGNERVTYREVVVRNGEETVAAIQALNNDQYDLWILGRKQGINPMLLHGLTNWHHNRELGTVGDYVASSDLGSSGSILVVQQQVLRGQNLATRRFLHKLSFTTKSKGSIPY